MKTKLFKAIAVAGLAIGLVNGVNAGSASGKISKIHYMPNGAVLFYLSGSHSDIPICSNNTAVPSRFAIDGRTNIGKIHVSGLITAYASGHEITVQGTRTCSLWGDTETVNYFHTND